MNARHPEIVLTLVHGTFAPNAEWTHSESPFCMTINELLKNKVAFRKFVWSGENTHQARLVAAKALQIDLYRALNEAPRAEHFIASHSHGGNIALYAMRDVDLSAHIKGIICIGTPFIVCKRRDTTKESRLRGGIWSTIGALLLLAAVGGLIASFLPELIGALVGGVCFVVLFSLFYDRIRKALKRRSEQRFPSTVQNAQRRTEQIYLPTTNLPPVFCIRTFSDEAFDWLWTLSKIGNAPFALWHFPHITTLFFTLMFLLRAVPFVYRVGLHPDIYWIPLAGLAIFQSAQDVIYYLAFFQFIIMPLLPKILHGSRYAFGGESIGDNLYTHISVKTKPQGIVGSEVLDYITRVKGSGLNHSLLCQDENVFLEVSKWIANHCRQPLAQESGPFGNKVIALGDDTGWCESGEMTTAGDIV